MARSALSPTRPAATVAWPPPLGAIALALVVALVVLVLALSLALGRVHTPGTIATAPTAAATAAAAQPNTASYLDTAVHERDYCQCQK